MTHGWHRVKQKRLKLKNIKGALETDAGELNNKATQQSTNTHKPSTQMANTHSWPTVRSFLSLNETRHSRVKWWRRGFPRQLQNWSAFKADLGCGKLKSCPTSLQKFTCTSQGKSFCRQHNTSENQMYIMHIKYYLNIYTRYRLHRYISTEICFLSGSPQSTFVKIYFFISLIPRCWQTFLDIFVILINYYDKCNYCWQSL